LLLEKSNYFLLTFVLIMTFFTQHKLFITAVVLVTEAGVSVSALLAVAISTADLIKAAVSAAVAGAMEDCSRCLGRKTLVAAAVSAAETS
jgi:hypothetical protein